ncbi:MAG: hypothetical protein HY717_19720 [Planctomycetes bacterium]|nr:hypothetical protein [Planctomycetota bacterium]
MKFKIIWLLFPLLAWRAAALAQSPAAEWTLEEAISHWQPMVRPVQHVGVPGYPFQAAVLWDGALVFGPLDFRQLKVMQEEIASLGDNLLHLSFAHGDPPRFLDRRGSGSPALRRFLELGRLPIPHVVARCIGLEWDERVFAHLLGRPLDRHPEPRPDDLLVVQASFTAYNPGPGKRTGRLWMHFGDTSAIQLGYKCAQKEEPAPAIAHRYEAPLGLVGDQVRYLLPKPAKGELRWHDEIPALAGAGEKTAALKAVIEWAVPLDPGERASLRLSIPYGLISRKVAGDLLSADPERDYEAVRKFWFDLEHGAGQIITPDAFVNDYLAAVAGQMAQQVAFRPRSRVWMYKTSPNHYEGYWPCNAAKALPALDFRGLTHLSRPVLRSFVEQQSDDVRGMDKGVLGRDEGLAGEGYAKAHGFLGNFGEWTANPLLLSHGLGMWALATHYRITRDDQWLGSGPGSPLRAMIEAFDWVVLQRRRTKREVDGKKVAHWGLLPAASAHDWLAGNTIFNDAFCAYGMAEVLRLLREINHPRAEELARELADYRACIHDRYAEARDRARPVPLPDGTAIPYVPRMVQELDWAKLDWTYTGYGPLRAGAWGALDPKDPLVDQALAFLEAGMPKGQGAYFSAHQAALAEAGGRRPAADANWADISDPQAQRHWLWRHYVEYETMWPIGGPLFLARDDLPRFFEWLFHNLAAAIHRDWRVGVESLDGVPSCAPGDGERWQCLRKMFVHEYGGWDGSKQLLGLLQALPRSWLKPGDRLAVRDLPTTFGGRVTLEVNIAPGGNAVRILAEWRDFKTLPRAIRMRLRSGDGRSLRSAKVNGEDANVLEGDLIELPVTESDQHRIVGRFE